jgi:hypothetical protein
MEYDALAMWLCQANLRYTDIGKPPTIEELIVCLLNDPEREQVVGEIPPQIRSHFLHEALEMIGAVSVWDNYCMFRNERRRIIDSKTGGYST